MDFGKSVFGGELTVTGFGDGGMAQDPGREGRSLRHALPARSAWRLHADGVRYAQEHGLSRAPTAPFISLSGDDAAALEGYWKKLSAGATITMPLAKAPWGDSFGMLADKPGVSWLVNIGALTVAAESFPLSSSIP